MSNPAQSVTEDLTADDGLVERTDNGLRPGLDAELEQPSQDPADVPFSVLGPDGQPAERPEPEPQDEVLPASTEDAQ